MTVESAFGGPERVDEVEATFVNVAGDATLETGQRVQGGRGGEQIGKGCARDSEKSTLRRGLSEKPVSDGSDHREAQMSDERDGSGGGVEVSNFLGRLIAPGVVRSFQPFQTANQLDHIGRFGPKIFVGAQGDKCVIGRSETSLWIPIIASIALTKFLEVCENGC